VILDQQLEDLAQRASPWRHQAIIDRRRLKGRLAALQEEDPEALQQLIVAANAEEQPWLRLYTASNEPALSLEKLVDAADASGEEQRKVDRTTRRHFARPGELSGPIDGNDLRRLLTTRRLFSARPVRSSAASAFVREVR